MLRSIPMRYVTTLFLAGFLSAQPSILIKTSNILDGRGSVLKNTNISVRGSRITAVAGGGQGQLVYDLRGLTVMPGWIDTHVHIGAHFDRNGRASMGSTDMLFPAANAYATLMGGFTTIQSLGAPADKELRDAIAAGEIP